jgi:integrase
VTVGSNPEIPHNAQRRAVGSDSPPLEPQRPEVRRDPDVQHSNPHRRIESALRATLNPENEMPRPRPPHLHREISRHGRPLWYVRVGKGARTRIRAEYGSPQFDIEYQAAVTGAPRPQRGKAAPGSLAWLVERYRETTAWMDLSVATRRNREIHFREIIKTAGNVSYRAITNAHVVAGRERRAATPSWARKYLDAMRGLFRWAKEAGHVTVDPTERVKNPQPRKGAGFRKWSEEDAAAYERRWPIGTRERVWRDVLFYTGLRRGDAVRLGRQHVKNGVAELRTEKSQGEVAVYLPILPILQRTIDAGPTGDLAFICGKNGRPFTKESFGNMFKKACLAAGLTNASAHGCRKIAATRAADSGATIAQLNAIFGWRGSAMASLYTQEADRKRLAADAMNKLATSIPAPCEEVRATAPKRKRNQR